MRSTEVSLRVEAPGQVRGDPLLQAANIHSDSCVDIRAKGPYELLASNKIFHDYFEPRAEPIDSLLCAQTFRSHENRHGVVAV